MAVINRSFQAADEVLQGSVQQSFHRLMQASRAMARHEIYALRTAPTRRGRSTGPHKRLTIHKERPPVYKIQNWPPVYKNGHLVHKLGHQFTKATTGARKWPPVHKNGHRFTGSQKRPPAHKNGHQCTKTATSS